MFIYKLGEKKLSKMQTDQVFKDKTLWQEVFFCFLVTLFIFVAKWNKSPNWT